MAGTPIPDDLSDPRWAHDRLGVCGDCETDDKADVHVEAESELEATYGPEVFEDDRAPLAADIVAIDEANQRGVEWAYPPAIIGEENLRDMLSEAIERDDEEDSGRLVAQLAVVNPKRFREILMMGAPNENSVDQHASDHDVGPEAEKPEPESPTLSSSAAAGHRSRPIVEPRLPTDKLDQTGKSVDEEDASGNDEANSEDSDPPVKVPRPLLR